MAILVTGGAGYIGSHTVKALLAEERHVAVYDDFSAGHRAACEALRPVGGRLDVVEGDVADAGAVELACRAHAVDAVMHFAAWLSVGESVREPAGYYRNNVIGTLGLLEGLRRAEVRRLVFSSTCATFGEPARVPIDETLPQRPINAYGETKLAIERALPHYQRAYGLEAMVLRYFNAAGADPDGLIGEDHDPEIHLIPNAIAAARGGPPLQIFGDDYPTPDGTCLRDYIHVSDLATAHLLALGALEAGHPSAAFNLGTGVPHSVRQVLDAVSRVAGCPVPATLAPRRPGDPSALYAANDRIRTSLGWAPTFVAIDDIVDTAWRWHAAHPEGYRDRRPIERST